MFGFGKKAWSQHSRIASVAKSDRGLQRIDNEDSFYADDDRLVYCVADGMGGGAEGAMASAIVCREVRMMSKVAADDFAQRAAALQHSLVDANEAIFEYAQRKGYRQMGSTVALLLLDDRTHSRAQIIHIGDSRVYRIRGGLATMLTKDHSIGFELGDFAGPAAERFRDRANPLAHVLTRAIGVQAEVKCEVGETDVRPGDRFVVCSDGVHDVITDARLAIFAAGGTLASASARLAGAIEKAGAPDNYTFILIEVAGS